MNLRKCVFRGLAVAAAVCAASGSSVAQDFASPIREQKTVMIGGARESWRLQWDAQPLPACGPEDLEVALGCRCKGFAYGESGQATLVRLRPGHPQQRLELAPFFRDQGAPGAAGAALLQRWRPIPAAAHDEDDDWHHAADFNFMKQVHARGAAELMKFGDYNHDGRASEFLLQVGVRPCGVPRLILIGVSRRNPQLHVFASAELPGQPLVLPGTVWAAVLRSPKPVHAVESSCSDPDSAAESTVEVSVQRGVFHVRRESGPCPRSAGPGEANGGSGY